MTRFFRFIIGLLGWLFSLGFTLLIIGCVAGVLLFNHFSKDLPDYTHLAHYDPPTVTRLYAADGKLLAEYAEEKRVFVPLSAIPRRVRQAFISAEDKNFYEHEGIDFTGVARAVRDNIVNYGQGKSLVGGSTITQQVVKNFLLTNEKSISRKIKEAILAMRISQAYSKDKILELYLNEIYLGLGSYGVAEAAQNYFNKSLDDLTIEEAALLASQPKGPALYDPRRNYQAALARRNWVIDRMRDGGAITAADADAAKNTPIVLRKRDPSDIAHADYFAEEVRRELAGMYGENALYEGGLVVRTTLDPALQQDADRALRRALIAYDRRHGYRGPVARLATFGAKPDDWKEQLIRLTRQHEWQLLGNQRLALVTTADDRRAGIIFDDDSHGVVPLAALKWALHGAGEGVNDILKVGDVALVGPLTDEEKKSLSPAWQKKSWDLEQVPEVNGAMVVINPHTGRVLALSGGYAYDAGGFDRATQARRQPGSAFKPFVYTAGLENGFTPSTVLLDAPVEMSQGAGLPEWKPQNYHDDYLGPITMRVALEKSRNTWTVRLAQIIGLKKIIAMGKRFGIYDALPPNFSIVLGSAETTLLKLTNAYGIIADGGKHVTPSLIERIDDRHGTTIFRRDSRVCTGCQLAALPPPGDDSPPPLPEDDRQQLVDPRIAYQVTSMLEGVAIRGTGARAHRELKNIVAGKTGTTNDSRDAWFIGFTPDLVAGVYVGYDTPRTLGEKETGASVALPGFIGFMQQALKNTPNTPFHIPPGIQLIKVDLHTGLPVSAAAPAGTVINEAFVTGPPLFIPGVTSPGNAPVDQEPADAAVPSRGGESTPRESSPPVPAAPEQEPPPIVGTGGLY
ncbi:MAG: penicillin-binding protein 1A [Pseudomonadota bacterium]|nr:penicillin-binding protein 1A [Pseudomonadota bacterium]